MYVKYHPKMNRETEFDEEGNSKIEFEYDTLGRPRSRKIYFWEF
jgi:YD repeat-containing protein